MSSTLVLDRWLEEHLAKSRALAGRGGGGGNRNKGRGDKEDDNDAHNSNNNNNKSPVAGAGDVPETVGRQRRVPALEGLGLDRATLQSMGLDKPKQDALFRSLFVYSHGVHNIVSEYSSYDRKLPGRIWNALLYLVDSCEPGNTELLTSEIKEIYTHQIDELVDFHSNVMELGEAAMGRLSTSEALAKLKSIEAVNSTRLDNMTMEALHNSMRKQIESQRAMLENAEKLREEVKDLYVETQTKLVARERELEVARRDLARSQDLIKEFSNQEATWKSLVQESILKVRDNDAKCVAQYEECMKMKALVDKLKERYNHCATELQQTSTENQTLKGQLRAHEKAKNLLILDRKRGVDIICKCLSIIQDLRETLGQFQNTVKSCVRLLSHTGSTKSSALLSKKQLTNTIETLQRRQTQLSFVGKPEAKQGGKNNKKLERSAASFILEGGRAPIVRQMSQFKGNIYVDYLPKAINVPNIVTMLKAFNDDTDFFLKFPIEAIVDEAAVPLRHRALSSSSANGNDTMLDGGGSQISTLDDSVDEGEYEDELECDSVINTNKDILHCVKYQTIAIDIGIFVEKVAVHMSNCRPIEESLLGDLSANCDEISNMLDYFELLQKKREQTIQINVLEALNDTYLQLLEQNKSIIWDHESQISKLEESNRKKDELISGMQTDINSIESWRKELAEAKEKISRIEKQNSELSAELSEAKEIIVSRDESIAELSADNEAKGTEIQTLSTTLTGLRQELKTMTEMYTRECKFREMYENLTYNWHITMEVVAKVRDLSKKSWKQFFETLVSKKLSIPDGIVNEEKQYLDYRGTDVFALLNKTDMREEEKLCVLDINDLAAKSIGFIDSYQNIIKQLLEQEEATSAKSTELVKLKLFYAKDKVRIQKLTETNAKLHKDLKDMTLKMNSVESESQEMSALAHKYAGEITSLNKRMKLMQQRNVFVKEEKAAPPAGPTINKAQIVKKIESITSSNLGVLMKLDDRVDTLQKKLFRLVSSFENVCVNSNLEGLVKLMGTQEITGTSLGSLGSTSSIEKSESNRIQKTPVCFQADAKSSNTSTDSKSPVISRASVKDNGDKPSSLVAPLESKARTLWVYKPSKLLFEQNSVNSLDESVGDDSASYTDSPRKQDDNNSVLEEETSDAEKDSTHSHVDTKSNKPEKNFAVSAQNGLSRGAVKTEENAIENTSHAQSAVPASVSLEEHRSLSRENSDTSNNGELKKNKASVVESLDAKSKANITATRSSTSASQMIKYDYNTATADKTVANNENRNKSNISNNELGASIGNTKMTFNNSDAGVCVDVKGVVVIESTGNSENVANHSKGITMTVPATNNPKVLSVSEMAALDDSFDSEDGDSPSKSKPIPVPEPIFVAPIEAKIVKNEPVPRPAVADAKPVKSEMPPPGDPSSWRQKKEAFLTPRADVYEDRPTSAATAAKYVSPLQKRKLKALDQEENDS